MVEAELHPKLQKSFEVFGDALSLVQAVICNTPPGEITQWPKTMVEGLVN
ncbi:hypothetical protein KKD62_01915 [Patescibacteria group bacterium]|nr:hypothetical protein [Patescibacteria group bacterium]MBU1931241.1 hypothetical protein [Patescibacteria group bacterium]